MGVEVDRRGSELAPGQFEDHEGYVGPVPSGFGARSSPLGQFPTGPEVGSRLPDVVALSTAGHTIDVDPSGTSAKAHWYLWEPMTYQGRAILNAITYDFYDRAREQAKP